MRKTLFYIKLIVANKLIRNFYHVYVCFPLDIFIKIFLKNVFFYCYMESYISLQRILVHLEKNLNFYC